MPGIRYTMGRERVRAMTQNKDVQPEKCSFDRTFVLPGFAAEIKALDARIEDAQKRMAWPPSSPTPLQESLKALGVVAALERILLTQALPGLIRAMLTVALLDAGKSLTVEYRTGLYRVAGKHRAVEPEPHVQAPSFATEPHSYKSAKDALETMKEAFPTEWIGVEQLSFKLGNALWQNVDDIPKVPQ